MRIEVKGRNVPVTDELRECAARKFERVAKQVSSLAVLEIELREANAGPATVVAEANLFLKGVTLRAESAAPEARIAVNGLADDMARQVKRHRDKRRARRESRAAAEATRAGLGTEPGDGALPAL